MSFAHSHQINFLPNVPRTLSANRTRRRVAHTAAKIGESLFFSVERETDCQLWFPPKARPLTAFAVLNGVITLVLFVPAIASASLAIGRLDVIYSNTLNGVIILALFVAA